MTVRSTSSALGTFPAVGIPTGRLADRTTSSLPRTGSDDEQNHHDDDGDDEGTRWRSCGWSRCLRAGGDQRPYSVSPIASPIPPSGLNGRHRCPPATSSTIRIRRADRLEVLLAPLLTPRSLPRRRRTLGRQPRPPAQSTSTGARGLLPRAPEPEDAKPHQSFAARYRAAQRLAVGRCPIDAGLICRLADPRVPPRPAAA